MYTTTQRVTALHASNWVWNNSIRASCSQFSLDPCPALPGWWLWVQFFLQINSCLPPDRLYQTRQLTVLWCAHESGPRKQQVIGKQVVRKCLEKMHSNNQTELGEQMGMQPNYKNHEKDAYVCIMLKNMHHAPGWKICIMSAPKTLNKMEATEFSSKPFLQVTALHSLITIPF